MTTRLFVAVSPPDHVAEELERMCVGLPGARWSDPEQYHLTLRFMGEVDGLVFDQVAEALAEVTFEPFDIQLEGFGCFPPRGQPKVLWAGVNPKQPLIDLRRRVERVMRSARIATEGRKYTPHLTVARLAGTPLPRLMRFLAAHALYRSEPFRVDAFHLYSSRLHPDGAMHEIEYTFSLD